MLSAASRRGLRLEHEVNLGYLSMTVAWVVGNGGLLGAALCRALGNEESTLFFPANRFSWGNSLEVDAQMVAAVQAFASVVKSNDRWQIYWAAGVGTMGSTQDDMSAETRALTQLLSLLAADPRLMAVPGAIAFASSAGAIYAGAADAVITENTTTAPTTIYAREKLHQEGLVAAFSLANSRTSALLARISTIYGPGQAAGKQQGLLTHIARRTLRNQPIQIYVPYDTIRDYIAVDDAAAAIICALHSACRSPGALIKIIASEHPTTIAEIVSVFKRLARRSPRIVTSASKLSALYTRRVQFRSLALPEQVKIPKKSLQVGIAQLMAAERAAFVKSRPKLLP